MARDHEGIGLGLTLCLQPPKPRPEQKEELVTSPHPHKKLDMVTRRRGVGWEVNTTDHETQMRKRSQKLFVKWEALHKYKLPNLLDIFILGLVLQAAGTSALKSRKML